MMALAIMTGCQTTRLDVDSRSPSIVVRDDGYYLADKRATQEDILDALADFEVPVKRTIHIRISDPRHLASARMLMRFLALHGFQNVVLVTERHASSSVIDEPQPPMPPAPKQIHWK